jgi:uncharacterized protein (DUF1499 family)
VVCCAATGGLALQTPSRVATAAAALGCAGAALFVLGPLAIQAGAASPFGGFRAFALALPLALLALLLGLAGLWTTRAHATEERTGRGRAWLAVLLGLGMLGAVAAAVAPSRDLPRINDITTNPDDPPQFRDPAFAYPGEAFASQQRAGYPDLATIQLALPPDDAFAHARRVASGLGWQIGFEDPAAGVLEATVVSRVFRFVDDVAVRVRPGEAGTSRVDVRSRSRVGQGDLGANAARIRAFRDALARG